jgi:sensor histidine kinase YesM
MSTATFFTPTIRKVIIHLLVLTITIKLATSYFPLAMVDSKYLWQGLGQFLLVVAAFYIHSLVLLPILMKKNFKKYFLFLLCGIIIYWVISNWFHASRSVVLTRYVDGTKPIPTDLFLQNIWSIYHFLATLAALIPFSGVSLLYHILFIDKKDRKAPFFLKYTEFITNLIILVLILLLFFVNISSERERLNISFEFSLFIIFFYLNSILFAPIILKEKKTGKYLLLIFTSFIFIALGTMAIYGTHFLNTDFSDNLLVLIIFFLITALLSLTYGYIRLKLKNNEQVFNLKLGAKESELSLLKSQVNPHFLFNTLNTLYATALEEQAPKTAHCTAKLANLIRYMQEDINKDFIALENEIKYIEDYIIIQKLRCEAPPTIETFFENIEGHTISPGLLIPFVENAFKYGIDPNKPSTLSITILCDDNSIDFECHNSYNESFHLHHKEQGFGLGIRNAKQRLELVYPNRHSFDINTRNNIFSVKIHIDIQKI